MSGAGAVPVLDSPQGAIKDPSPHVGASSALPGAFQGLDVESGADISATKTDD